MSELAARHLISNGVERVLVTNRTYERAVEMAEGFYGEVIPFEALDETLLGVDIVISSTGSPQPIITKETVCIRKRSSEPRWRNSKCLIIP